MTLRVFVAFDVDHDKDLFDLLLESSRHQGVYEVSGRSRSDAISDPWQQKTQALIAAADQVVVVCGEHTDQSERVSAEFRLAREQGKPVLLLWSRREAMCKKPVGARPDDSMYSWTADILRDQLLANQRKAMPVRVPDRLKRQTPPVPKAEG